MSKLVAGFDVDTEIMASLPINLYQIPFPGTSPEHEGGKFELIVEYYFEVSLSPQLINFAISQESLFGLVATPRLGIQ